MDDRLDAKYVELLVDETGKVWLNIDGKCVARVGHAEQVLVEVAGKPFTAYPKG